MKIDDGSFNFSAEWFEICEKLTSLFNQLVCRDDEISIISQTFSHIKLRKISKKISTWICHFISGITWPYN